MRDIVLAPIVFGIAAYGLLHPWLGVLGWTWISVMNPHAYAWRLNSLPVAAVVAGATLLGVLFTKDRRQFFVTRETAVLMLFMLWICITFPFSFDAEDSYHMLKRVMKIDLMVLVAMVVLYSRKHIITLVWVLVGSLGFFGVKGGLFVIATGGGYRVWAPEASNCLSEADMLLRKAIDSPMIPFSNEIVENEASLIALSRSRNADMSATTSSTVWL